MCHNHRSGLADVLHRESDVTVAGTVDRWRHLVINGRVLEQLKRWSIGASSREPKMDTSQSRTANSSTAIKIISRIVSFRRNLLTIEDFLIEACERSPIARN